MPVCLEPVQQCGSLAWRLLAGRRALSFVANGQGPFQHLPPRDEESRAHTAMEGSYEHLFHQLGLPRFVVPLRADVPEVLQQARPQRAVGVVYLPEQERSANYLQAEMTEQFDAVIHVDASSRLLPLAP